MITVMKICCTCRQEKALSEFYKNSRKKDGLYLRCKACHSKSVRAWQQKDGGIKHAENCDRYRKENPDRQRQNLRDWRERNRERYRNNEYEWRVKNSISVYARNKERTERQKLATPIWADVEKIVAIYCEARRLTADTGIKWHVDHLIPLCGELVSGLHIHSNLRVIPATENLRKNNHFHESMIGA